MDSPGDSTVIKEYQPAEVARIAGELRAQYADVYAEPPYYETGSDVINFEARLAEQLQEPSFLLITAWDEGHLTGYTYGFAINRDSALWANVFMNVTLGVIDTTATATATISTSSWTGISFHALFTIGLLVYLLRRPRLSPARGVGPGGHQIGADET